MIYQVTIYNPENKYKPASCLIQITKEEDRGLRDAAFKKAMIDRGIQRICALRRWDKRDLIKYGYSKVKIRIYQKNN